LLAGENRVGFFTKNDVEAGEELNFDYKYERYGQVSSQDNTPVFLIRIRLICFWIQTRQQLN
jgi:hypothetical protein